MKERGHRLRAPPPKNQPKKQPTSSESSPTPGQIGSSCFITCADGGAVVSVYPDGTGTCPGSSKSSSGTGKNGSLAIIVPVVVAAVLLVAAVLFLVRKRAVAARQPHRDASMPNVGDEDEVQA